MSGLLLAILLLGVGLQSLQSCEDFRQLRFDGLPARLAGVSGHMSRMSRVGWVGWRLIIVHTASS